MLKSSAEHNESKQNGGSSVGGRLKQKLDKEYRYSREEMLCIAKCNLSLQRPSYLSTEFDNENGKFQPDKWLEYRWVCEGIENRPAASVRRKDKIKPEVLDGNSTVLSPQRRGFSSGCRAASPHKNDAEPERLGTNKSNWRSGAGFMLKTSTASTDFKPSFQKNATSAGENAYPRRQSSNAERRTAGDGSFKPSFHKDTQSQNRNRVASGMSNEEKVPEWLEEGPTSMHDMIELKGFDDERKNTKRGASNKSKKEALAKQTQQKLGTTGKASVANRLEASLAQTSGEKVKTASIDLKSSRGSTPIEKEEKSRAVEPSGATDNLSSPKTDALQKEKTAGPSVLTANLLSNKLPNSDAEFAAIMGLLDANEIDPLKENVISPPTVVSSEPAACSRLSRFFSTTNKNEANANGQHVPPGDSNNNESSLTVENDTCPPSNSLLRKIFASSQSSSPMLVEPAVPTSLPGVVRAEDLEKGFRWEAAKGSHAPPSTSSATDHLQQLGFGTHSSATSRQQQLFYQVSKGNPLGDPQQQAQLMNKLNKVARQQDLSCTEEMVIKGATVPSPLMSQHISIPGCQMSGNLGEQQRLRSGAHVPALQGAVGRSQIDATFLKNLHMAQQQQTATLLQNTQPSDANAVRSMLANLMASNNAFRAGGSGLGMPSTASISQPRSSSTAVPNAFMPTSVMRQMTKHNVSVEDRQRKAGLGPMTTIRTEEEKQRCIGEDVARKQAEFMRSNAAGLNGNNPDVISKLLQQQYMHTLAAMRAGVPPNSWPVPPQMLPQLRAQIFAASHAELQRLYTTAILRKDFGQAQAIRAHMLTQQAAAASLLNPNVPATSSVHLQHNPQTAAVGQAAPCVSGGASQVSDASAQNVHKYQSPLEKLLQSAGVPTKQPPRGGPQDRQQGAHVMPSIISRLPPQANCISVEDLEKQYASN